MKKVLFLTVAMSVIPMVTLANGIDDVEFSVGVKNGNLSYKAAIEDGGFSEIHLGYEWYKKDYQNGYRFTAYSAIEREFGDYQRTKLINDFRVTKTFENWNGLYAIANVDYDFTHENLIIGPTFGGFISFGEKASAYADITASFNATDNFEYIGAEIGAGVSYNVANNVWMTVGFTRNIDTDWDEENSFYLNTMFVY